MGRGNPSTIVDNRKFQTESLFFAYVRGDKFINADKRRLRDTGSGGKWRLIWRTETNHALYCMKNRSSFIFYNYSCMGSGAGGGGLELQKWYILGLNPAMGAAAAAIGWNGWWRAAGWKGREAGFNWWLEGRACDSTGTPTNRDSQGRQRRGQERYWLPSIYCQPIEQWGKSEKNNYRFISSLYRLAS